jgi:hypothetical protein
MLKMLKTVHYQKILLLFKEKSITVKFLAIVRILKSIFQIKILTN